MKQSNLFTLNWHDALKGLLMAILTPVFFLAQQTINSGNLTFNWKALGMAAVAGGLGYLAKNFFTPADPVKVVEKTPNGTVVKTKIETDQVDVNLNGDTKTQ